MSIIGKVVRYNGCAFYIENHGKEYKKIKLSPSQAEGFAQCLPFGKEPADMVGQYVRAFVKKKAYSFVDVKGKRREGFNYRLLKMELL